VQQFKIIESSLKHLVSFEKTIRPPLVFQAGYGPGSHTPIFSITPLPASNNFWTKFSSARNQMFFYRSIFCYL